MTQLGQIISVFFGYWIVIYKTCTEKLLNLNRKRNLSAECSEEFDVVPSGGKAANIFTFFTETSFFKFNQNEKWAFCLYFSPECTSERGTTYNSFLFPFGLTPACSSSLLDHQRGSGIPPHPRSAFAVVLCPRLVLLPPILGLLLLRALFLLLWTEESLTTPHTSSDKNNQFCYL